MPPVPTVPVMRVSDGFHARVIAARLGAEGIVTQLRGGMDSPYPMGDVEVLVAEGDLDDARAILLADEVEAAFEDDEVELSPRRRMKVWVALAVSATLVLADITVVAFRR
jgi:hypothetical protein